MKEEFLRKKKILEDLKKKDELIHKIIEENQYINHKEKMENIEKEKLERGSKLEKEKNKIIEILKKQEEENQFKLNEIHNKSEGQRQEMKIIHGQKMIKIKEESNKELKRLEDQHIENKRNNENERQKIEQDFFNKRININNNFLEEMNRIEESHNIRIDYINGIHQHNMNKLNNYN